MEQFFVVAAAHFLALLLPGPDFFLIARTSLRAGWRVASGACLGIALANAVFIAVAFSGVAAVQASSWGFKAVQWAGSAYLFYLGWLFVRHAGSAPLGAVAAVGAGLPAPRRGQWWRSFAMGWVSGILNPKNALFYASLATVLASTHTPAPIKLLYGIWMFLVVLLWDMAVALLVGNQRMLQRFAQALPWLERGSGLVLMLMAAGMAVLALLRG